MHGGKIFLQSSLIVTFVLFPRWFGCCHKLISLSSFWSCLYSLYCLLLLTRCAAKEWNSGGLCITCGKQKQRCYAIIAANKHQIISPTVCSLFERVCVWLVVVLSVASLAVVPVPVFQLQNNFLLYHTSLECYTQETFPPRTSYHFGDEALWWLFIVVNEIF